MVTCGAIALMVLHGARIKCSIVQEDSVPAMFCDAEATMHMHRLNSSLVAIQ